MAKKYSCKNCGAELFFDPKTGKLHCDYCGSDFDPELYDFTPEDEAKEDQTIPQFSEEGGPDASYSGDTATDESVSLDDLVVYKCPNCGAEVITSKKTVATTCVYCNRAITLTGNVSGEFRPDYVLPFKKERKDVEAAYRALCKHSFLTPRLFSHDSTVEKIKGMYVPYWMYTFDGVSSMQVRAENDNDMMDSIEPFDFSQLTKFNPAYLTGFYTQRWDETSEENEPRAKERAHKALSEAVLSHTGSYNTRTIESEHNEWSEVKVEQVMIPVWMMYTEYKGKKYVFGMNGQTGKMMGRIPRDPVRIIEVGGIVFFISQVIMMILRILGVM